MKIRFIRSWQSYKPGQEFTFADGFANVLIRRGIVIRIEVEDEKPGRKKPKQLERMIPPLSQHA